MDCLRRFGKSCRKHPKRERRIMDIDIVIDCEKCGEEITHHIKGISRDTKIHIKCFNDAWECLECGHTTLLKDLNIINFKGCEF